MTELKRARAHLLKCQAGLRQCRFFWNDTKLWEKAVLAALDWVWKEQQKECRRQESQGLWATRHASLA
jgi:hypothetical protein